MSESQPFQVNLSELESITDRLSGFVKFLTDSMSGLQQRIDSVQQNWNGSGADAQAEAFQKWMTGAAEVSEGIEEMKRAAAEAHTHYSRAATTNSAMLGGR
ncbi:WXG100 family type VII secretion target [Nocardia sp. NBC_01503]|uniref:WXG100 family type VII secretion target n=1 Tax=Nocardia sp. NBC_01503 TaxID=2975997 RepID=UPI002E7B046C|nr:WXG100 family type VII secretion target [Nocardia sp. NBC_01503]WTL33800.1 WXG100 family type VII secretion target [Nocardia sp. NBC_01503]